MKRNIVLAVFTILAVLALSLSGCSANNQPAETNPAASNPANINSSANQSSNPVNQNSNTNESSVPNSSSSNTPSSVNEGPVASAPIEATGNLQFRVTDAPAKEIKSIMVTVTSVEVHKAGNETEENTTESTEDENSEGDSEDNTSWTNVELEDDGDGEDGYTFDLLVVKDNPQQLAFITATTGKYTQIRMEVSSVDIYFADNIETAVPAIVPSGKIKLVNTFEVAANSTTDLLCDFDAAQSVNISGNGKVMFKPVIKVTAGKPEKNNNGDKDNNKVKDLKITTPETVTVVRDNIDNTVELNLNANGGVKPYTWSYSQEGAPDDLELDENTGKISFIDDATDPNTFTFEVSVSDSSDQELPQKLTVIVVDPLRITTESLGSGEINETFTSVDLQAEGGTEDYTWDIIDGEIPGLTLSEDGVLSGTPTQAGDFEIMIQVTDSSEPAFTATQEYTLSIAEAQA